MTSDAPTSSTAEGRVTTATLEPGISAVTLTSPARLNAMSRDMREQLASSLQRLDADPEVRAIVLTGAGERAFSAGQDLSEAKSFTGDDAERWVGEWTSLYEVILSLRTPTVAALNGYAVGAGLQTALMCDVRVAASTVRVGMPEVNDAIPCITGSWSLARIIGDGQIADLVLTGRLVDADEMLRWGLVSHVVEPDRLMERAIEIARQLGKGSRLTLELDKAWLRVDRLERLPAARAAAEAAHRKAFESGEPAQVLAAFLSRRSASPLT